MRRLFAVLALLIVAACTRGNASPPKPGLTTFAHVSGHQVAPDSLVSIFTCTAGAPDTFCGLTGTVGSLTLFSGNVPVGGTQRLSVPCSAPGAHVVLSVSVVGIAPGVANSAPALGSVAGDCPLASAVQPSFILTPFLPVHPGGS